MRRFSELIEDLDRTTSTLKKVEALRRYFADAGEADRLWTIALLSNKRPKRTVRTALLAQWAAEEAGIPLWLFEITYHSIGDFSEAIALVWPHAQVPVDTDAPLRTVTHYIELILGLPPMNQLDLSATAMRECFAPEANLTPYKARPAQIPRDEMNPPLKKLKGTALHWAKKSIALSFDEADEADDDTLNRIVWHSMRGDQPYPHRWVQKDDD